MLALISYQRNNDGELSGASYFIDVVDPWVKAEKGEEKSMVKRVANLSEVMKPMLATGYDCRCIFDLTGFHFQDDDDKKWTERLRDRLKTTVRKAWKDESQPIEVRANILCGSGKLPHYMLNCAQEGDREAFAHMKDAMHPVWREEYRHQLQAAEASVYASGGGGAGVRH